MLEHVNAKGKKNLGFQAFQVANRQNYEIYLTRNYSKLDEDNVIHLSTQCKLSRRIICTRRGNTATEDVKSASLVHR